MRNRVLAAAGAVVLMLALAAPVGAQADSITATPSTGLLDGDVVQIDASTAGSVYGTLALCPTDQVPAVGHDPIDLLRLSGICVGLACLHDGTDGIGLAEFVQELCPVSEQAPPIATVSVAVPLPRITNDGTDCARTACSVVFNTWTPTSATGAVSLPVSFDDTVPPPTTVPLTPTIETTTTTTTTTIALSSPSTVAPPPSTTVPTQVLGTTETNDQLAVTGADPALFAALGLAMVAAGALIGRRARSSSTR